MARLSKRKLKVWLFQFGINCNSTMRISICLYQKPQCNSRNHPALQSSIQSGYEVFRMILKNGFLRCSFFILSFNRWKPFIWRKHRSIVQLATQYLFPTSWKITFKQSLFLMWDCLCLFDTPMKFLCSFFCLLFCFVFFMRNRCKVKRKSLYHASR